jgi:hypothetical protein
MACLIEIIRECDRAGYVAAGALQPEDASLMTRHCVFVMQLTGLFPR